MKNKFHISGARFRFSSRLKTKLPPLGVRVFFSILAFIILASSICALAFLRQDDDTSALNLPNSSNMVEVRFLNTTGYNSIVDDTHYTSNESVMLKTYDGKYVLIDTANRNDNMLRIIYNNLHELQGTTKVTIDYLIISHFHGDHVGNAVTLLNNSQYFDVKNIVFKYEQTGEANNINYYKFADVLTAARNAGANIYTSSNVASSSYADSSFNYIQDGYAINVGSYLKLYLYNTPDVFAGKTCSTGTRLRFYAYNSAASLQADDESPDYIVKFNGKYVYFDGSNYPNVRMVETDEFVQKSGATPMDKYFYAYAATGETNCNSNGNSLAVFAEVKNNTNQNKYMYFPNDIENIGYSVAGTDGIFGNNFTVLYDNIDNFYNRTTGQLNPSPENLRLQIPSETNAARKIANDFGVTNLANITIYGAAHHSLNNAPDAINTLGLNKPSTNSIATYYKDPGGTALGFDQIRYSHYALKNAKQFYVAYSADGVNCIINAAGNTYCGYETTANIHTFTLTYGNQDNLASQSCIGIESCTVNITNGTPNKPGYTFLGWADSATATSASYQPGESITLSANKTIYAVWKLNTTTRTLAYNANDGAGAPSTQTCTATGTATSCSITISSTAPTRSGYTFLGWADSDTATTPQYQPGANITLTADKIIYAVWRINSVTRTLTFNANNGTGAPATQNCTATGTATSCSVEISSTAPTRSGYTFLGWADSATATSASYQPGESITLSANKTIYAVWKLNTTTRTLAYNANDGAGAPSTQTCTATGTATSCSITISSTAPTRSGYTFLGWADSDTATAPQYQPNANITLSSNKTIYAVWEFIDPTPDPVDPTPDPDDPTPEPDTPDNPTPTPDEPTPTPEDPAHKPNRTPDTGHISNSDTSAKTTGLMFAGAIALSIICVYTYKRHLKKSHRKFD